MATLVHARPQSKPVPAPGRLVRAGLSEVLHLVALAVACILALPVFLLPFTTAVPSWLWILLILGELLLFGLLMGRATTWLALVQVYGGTLALGMLAVAASQLFAATPIVPDEMGEPLAGSIATLEQVNLNGNPEWILVRGQNRANPVLLNLGANQPGEGAFAARPLLEPLEKNFVVVSWDAAGAGKSYAAAPTATLSPERYLADAYALTQLLRARFHQDKLYLYGSAWSSLAGIQLIQQDPQLYYAYIGTGQLANLAANDALAYRIALQYAGQQHDAAAVDTLKTNGPPPYAGPDMRARYDAYRDVLNQMHGAPRGWLSDALIPFGAPEYGYLDKLNHLRGLTESFEIVYPQLQTVDLRRQANTLNVPVYFFAGCDDMNVMASLTQQYYNALQAPHKQLLWLDGGRGLSPDNSDQFAREMVKTVLAQTGAGNDR